MKARLRVKETRKAGEGRTATVRQVAAEWLDYRSAEGALASTLRNYRQTLDYILLPFCERRGIEQVEQLDQAAMDRLAGELLDRKNSRTGQQLSRTSVNSYLQPVKAMTTWAREQGYDLLGRPRTVREVRKPKDILTRAEIQQIENAVPTERDKLLIRLLADTGMRIGEACKLRPRDLLERNRQWFLYVQGKGLNDRFVPVPRIHRRLRTWIEQGRRQPCADVIFTVLHARAGYYGGLGYTGAWKAVRNAAEMADIGKRVHPHLLRHTLITHLRRKGHNDAQVSMVVGNHTALANYTWLEAGDAYGFMADLD